ncbi:AraC family transcriptional regulator [Bacillus coahuilensis m2-6]|uniref:AraC family transcriptional regulator n=1 Tax=Bacillus coahuilensis p1.1.43 TaxID=1150625 RepID=A0A147KBP1_9BACI|nr:AraC family transcriptional regulator [Bacillus coahuilensis]KUP08835.1 AraC family transcriptional regulator [Bacillus coahuilensis p1.1.43]KUP09728.1 AraC family transcriptional regulator [Bacillus coahuilensis m2-6]
MLNRKHDTFLNPLNEEVIYQDPLLYLKVWEIDVEADYTEKPEDCPWHYHKEVEFVAILEGNMGMQTKDEHVLLSEGDVILFGSSQPHRTYKPYPIETRYIVFQVDLRKHIDEGMIQYANIFSEITAPLDRLNYIFRQSDTIKNEFFNIIQELLKESQEKEKGYEIAISTGIKQLMLKLLRYDTQHVLHATDSSDIARLQPLLDYVDNHLSERLPVEEAAQFLNLNYHYFMRYFKKAMGITFVEYVHYKRIKKAELLLLTSELSITEVSFAVGIPNLPQFYKLFKRYNDGSPKEFRERMRES